MINIKEDKVIIDLKELSKEKTDVLIKFLADINRGEKENDTISQNKNELIRELDSLDDRVLK